MFVVVFLVYSQRSLVKRHLQVTVDRQCDSKTSEDLLLALQLDDASELLHDLLRDVQPKPDAFLVDLSVFLHHFPEEHEHLLLVLFANPDSCVKAVKRNGVLNEEWLVPGLSGQTGWVDTKHNVAFERELG